MRVKHLIIFLLLLSTAWALAQEQPKPTESKIAKFIMVSTTQLNPTKAMTYDKLNARFRKVAEETKMPVDWIAVAPITGNGHDLTYLTFANSYADLDAQGAAFEKLMGDIAMKDASVLTESAEAETTWNTELLEFQPKLSYNAEAVDGAQVTRWMVTRYNLKPGSYMRFAALVNEVMELYKSVPDNKAHWEAYRVVAGGHPAVMIVRPMKALADMDEENPAVEKAFSKVVMSHLDDVVRETVSSVESNLYMARPELSRPPQQYVTENAAFWAPKAMEPAAPQGKIKKAAKKEPAKK